MLTPFPETGRIAVPPALARELLEGAEHLPLYDNKEFYSPALQSLVLERVRGACPDGFEWLLRLVKERLAPWPYFAVVQGLLFDGGDRVFVAVNPAFAERVARPHHKPPPH